MRDEFEQEEGRRMVMLEMKRERIQMKILVFKVFDSVNVQISLFFSF